MRTRAYVVVAIAVLAGLCGCGGGARSSAALAWHTCASGFQCATLSVPVSYADPGGAQISLSVIEFKASQPHPIADIVLNPGGPGVSGVEFLKGEASQLSPALRAKFNLVSFDPRGVGASHPLQCLTARELAAWAALDPAPQTPQEVAAVVKAAKDLARGCEKNASTAFISSMSTANNARDMDRLRAALGQKQLTYVGFSYGTYLGTVYAEMFPKNIRGMVLDGAVDPSLGVAAAEAGQAAGFESDLHDFFTWCESSASCNDGLTPTPEKAFAALFRRFASGHTVTAFLGSRAGGDTQVGYGLALEGVLATLYSKTSWPILGKALADAERGNGSYLAAFAYSLAGLQTDGSFSNIVSANVATGCVDGPSLPTVRAHADLAKSLSKTDPYFGALVAWTGLPCLFMPGRSQKQPSAAHAPGAPPILVVGSTHDPATPYAWAQALAKQLPQATLLTRIGAGHTAYRSSSCIRQWVDLYLVTLKMPPAGTTCPSY